MQEEKVRIEGKVIKYGDNIDTDEIIPARYLNTSDSKELAKHCMEGLDKDFLAKVKEKSIIAAGRNFGSGSSREHAPIALKEAGVRCIVAASFARIFFRNAINIGLPVVECKEAVKNLQEGDRVKVNIFEGKIYNLTRKKSYCIAPFPPFLQRLIREGGLDSYAKEKMRDE